MIPIRFDFHYHHADDTLEFVIQVGRAPAVGLRLPADCFLQLVDLIVKVWGPYSEGLKQKRAEGSKEDLSTGWDKILEDIQKEIDDG